LDEFYRVAFRKKIYRTIDELQTDLDAWTAPSGPLVLRQDPMQTFRDALPLAKEELMAA
jgi:hypothetical protein